MTPQERALGEALDALGSDLRNRGYAEDECRAIVDGASECAESHLASFPGASTTDLRAIVAEFHDPQIAPEAPVQNREPDAMVKAAWVSLALTVGGIVLLAPLCDALGGDGGAVMSLSALFGLPITGALAVRSRHFASARLAGYLAAFVALVMVGLVVVAFLTRPG